jgi:putative NADH-flavin reductase
MAKTLKIALVGATGMIGSRIAAEAASRGHEVTAFVRNPERAAAAHSNVKFVKGDLLDQAAMTPAVAGHDVIASAFSPPQGTPDTVVEATRALIAIARGAGIKRVVAVGGAGSLEVAPGVQLVDTEGFPALYKGVALAHREALGVYRSASDLDWTFFAPAALIAPGEKRGNFRTGANTLIVDADGKSTISAEDYAVAFVDEIEANRFVRQIATVAY